MHWLYLLFALAFLFAAAQATGWLVVLSLIAALVLVVAWVLGWAASQAARGSGNEGWILAPEALRRLHQQAEARKAAAAHPNDAPG